MGDGGPPSLGGDVLAQYIASLRSPVAITDAEFVVQWANDAFRSLGWEPSAVVGRQALDFVHPDDLAKAGVAISLLFAEPSPLQGAGSYRVLRADGGYQSVTAESIVLETDGGPLYAIALRADPYEEATTAVLASLAAGAPLDQALVPLTADIAPTRPAGLIAFDGDGRTVVGPLDPALAGVSGGRQDRTPGTPWHQALEELSVVTVVDLADLPEPTRAAAESAGLRAAAFLGTLDPGRPQPALLTSWAADPVLVDIMGTSLMDSETFVRLALDRRASHERLHHLAHHDDLTGLPNRANFFTQLGAAAERGQPVAVAYLDLDAFKPVNDTHGHAAGDAVLVELGRRFGREMRSGDLVARLGGDEFGVVLPGEHDEANATTVVERLLAAAREPIDVGDTVVTLTASAGLVVVDDAGEATADALVRRADNALYAAKRRGGGAVEVAASRQ